MTSQPPNVVPVASAISQRELPPTDGLQLPQASRPYTDLKPSPNTFQVGMLIIESEIMMVLEDFGVGCRGRTRLQHGMHAR